MHIKVTKGPDGSKFKDLVKYKVFVTKTSAFVFDDESEAYSLDELEYEEI